MPDADQSLVARRLTTLFVWAVAIGLVLRFFNPVMHVLLLLLGSATIAASLQPIARVVPGRRWFRGAAVGTTFWLLMTMLVAAMAWLLKAPIQRQIEQWPRIEATLNASLDQLGSWLGLDEPLIISQVATQAGQWLLGGRGGGETLASLANSVTGIVLALLMLVFGSIFLLAMRPDELISPVADRLPPCRARALRDSLWSLEPKLRWWLLGTLAGVVVSGVSTYIGLLIIGMQFALPVALVVGVSQIVPTLGPGVATFLALLLAATQGAGTFIAVAVLLAVVMTLESNVLTPLIMKRAVRMSPIVSLFTVVLWAWLLGPLGLLLAIPLNLVIWSAFIHFVPSRAQAQPDGAASSRPRPG